MLCVLLAVKSFCIVWKWFVSDCGVEWNEDILQGMQRWDCSNEANNSNHMNALSRNGGYWRSKWRLDGSCWRLNSVFRVERGNFAALKRFSTKQSEKDQATLALIFWVPEKSGFTLTTCHRGEIFMLNASKNKWGRHCGTGRHVVIRPVRGSHVAASRRHPSLFTPCSSQTYAQWGMKKFFFIYYKTRHVAVMSVMQMKFHKIARLIIQEIFQ